MASLDLLVLQSQHQKDITEPTRYYSHLFWEKIFLVFFNLIVCNSISAQILCILSKLVIIPSSDKFTVCGKYCDVVTYDLSKTEEIKLFGIINQTEGDLRHSIKLQILV